MEWIIKTFYNCFAMVVIKHLTSSKKDAEGVFQPEPTVLGNPY